MKWQINLNMGTHLPGTAGPCFHLLRRALPRQPPSYHGGFPAAFACVDACLRGLVLDVSLHYLRKSRRVLGPLQLGVIDSLLFLYRLCERSGPSLPRPALLIGGFFVHLISKHQTCRICIDCDCNVLHTTVPLTRDILLSKHGTS